MNEHQDNSAALAAANAHRQEKRKTVESLAAATERGDDLERSMKARVIELEGQLDAYHEEHGARLAAQIAAGSTDDARPVEYVGSIGATLAAAKIKYAIATSAAATLRNQHAAARAALSAAEADLKAAAVRVADAEDIADALKCIQMREAYLALKLSLQHRAAIDVHAPVNQPFRQVPVEVIDALSDVPLRNDLHVPVDQLRGANHQPALWTARIAKLMADNHDVCATDAMDSAAA